MGLGPGTQLSLNLGANSYKQRRPETTILYQAVSKNIRTFEAVMELEDRKLPKHVNEEFDTFLKCGVLAHGFLRLKCTDCKVERLVAFSCKKRGICSSCGGRRMAETAAHLVDEVFPKVGIRQWVLSFPMPVRYILARHQKHQAKVLTIVHRAIASFIKQKAKKKGFKLKLHPGAVTLIQRFGGSLNLNVHYHMLFMEGGYYKTYQGPKYWWVDPPTDTEIKNMVKLIAQRVIRYLKKHGYFNDDGEQAVPESEFTQQNIVNLPRIDFIGGPD